MAEREISVQTVEDRPTGNLMIGTTPLTRIAFTAAAYATVLALNLVAFLIPQAQQLSKPAISLKYCLHIIFDSFILSKSYLQQMECMQKLHSDVAKHL